MINGANLKVQTKRAKALKQTSLVQSSRKNTQQASCQVLRKKNCCQTNCLTKLTKKILDCSCCITDLLQQFLPKKLEFGDSERIIRPTDKKLH